MENKISIPEEDMRMLLEYYFKYTSLIWIKDLDELLEEAIPYYLTYCHKNKYASIDELVDFVIEHLKVEGKF